MDILLVFLLGIISSFLSNIAGGGGYHILLPSMIHLGVPPLQAIGTIKVGGIGNAIGSFVSSSKKNIIRKDHLKPLLFVAIFASTLGPTLAILQNENTVKIISAMLIFFTACLSILSIRAKFEKRHVSKSRKLSGYAAYFGVGTVQAGFGSGLGMINTQILMTLLGMTAIESIATRRYVALLGLPIQLIFFASFGHVNYILGLALLAGTIVGGFLGLNFAIKKGNEFVKKAMAVVAIGLVVSLFV